MPSFANLALFQVVSRFFLWIEWKRFAWRLKTIAVVFQTLVAVEALQTAPTLSPVPGLAAGLWVLVVMTPSAEPMSQIVKDTPLSSFPNSKLEPLRVMTFIL
jgi:hypothetical protein